MVSTLSLEEKYNRVRRNFCFFLDIQDHGLARSLSRRLQDMGLQQEGVLSSRVTHVVRDAPRPACARDMPAPAQSRSHHHLLTVHKAISLLDKLYDTFFTAPRKSHVKTSSKDFIKIEFLDKQWRPVFKEFDEWPELAAIRDRPREKDKKGKEEKIENRAPNDNAPSITPGQKMTRKSRARGRERDDKEMRGGYCEMCHADYVDAAQHQRSPRHTAFVRDHGNFLALDALIAAGADVAAFLDNNKSTAGERALCNGVSNPPSPPAAAPAPAQNGEHSPRRNGSLPRRGARTAYYKVIGVGGKLRSSGAFTKKRDSPPPPPASPPNAPPATPLVVKFRKVRRSELSVLSDEAEQFMFPRRASSTASSEEEESESPQPPPPPSNDRRRLARPLALKEESSEDDSWPEDRCKRRRRRPSAVPRRTRRMPLRRPSETDTVEPKTETVEETPASPLSPPPVTEPGQVETVEIQPVAVPAESTEAGAKPMSERCMKWEGGKLVYSAAVEQLQFAFEAAPHSEPWFETFRRQDEERVAVRNLPQLFELYSSPSPKLPYEVGQLPPLKANCCPLSELVKREERQYGTRGTRRRGRHRRLAALPALEAHPRKSPREHASTLAILGSAGLLRRRAPDTDSKSTASEDTVGEAPATPVATTTESRDHASRLQHFLSEQLADAVELACGGCADDAALLDVSAAPDVAALVAGGDACRLVRDQLTAATAPRRARRTRKRNRTGWPRRRRRPTGDSRASSAADDSARSCTTDAEDGASLPSEPESPPVEAPSENVGPQPGDAADERLAAEPMEVEEDRAEAEERVRKTRASCSWLVPVVRVARVETALSRRLRSAVRRHPR